MTATELNEEYLKHLQLMTEIYPTEFPHRFKIIRL